jgi:hypothetical protein
VAAEYVLFPDRREDDANADEGQRITADGTAVEAVPDDVLPRLARIDWAYPALVVYREDADDRWNQVTLGLGRPWMGEGDGHRDPTFLDGY